MGHFLVMVRTSEIGTYWVQVLIAAVAVTSA